MDYTMEAASIKGKNQIKLVIDPTNNLEREFFNALFAGGTAIVETVPNSDEITITIKEKAPITADDGDI